MHVSSNYTQLSTWVCNCKEMLRRERAVNDLNPLFLFNRLKYVHMGTFCFAGAHHLHPFRIREFVSLQGISQISLAQRIFRKSVFKAGLHKAATVADSMLLPIKKIRDDKVKRSMRMHHRLLHRTHLHSRLVILGSYQKRGIFANNHPDNAAWCSL